MAEKQFCPTCGAEIPSGSLEGHCPKCMARIVFGASIEQELALTDAQLTELGVDTNSPDPKSQPGSSPSLRGQRIGRYKLLEQIGEGGFGLVYMAEQVEPVQRKVALKIVKAGMDSHQIIAR